jgi:hypothetical protein
MPAKQNNRSRPDEAIPFRHVEIAIGKSHS